jgi:ammonia channel protein AmtB
MGAIIIGVLAGFLCLWGVSDLKKMLGADDSLDIVRAFARCRWHLGLPC